MELGDGDRSGDRRRRPPRVHRHRSRVSASPSTPAHTYTALAELERFAALDRPILSGPSRKSFLNAALGPRPPASREWGTAAAVTASILLGAHIVRVHGVPRDARRRRDLAGSRSEQARSRLIASPALSRPAITGRSLRPSRLRLPTPDCPTADWDKLLRRCPNISPACSGGRHCRLVGPARHRDRFDPDL